MASANGGSCSIGHGGSEIAIQEPIHHEHSLGALIAVGLELFAAFALFVLQRQTSMSRADPER
jgi:hypothetical protein